MFPHLAQLAYVSITGILMAVVALAVIVVFALRRGRNKGDDSPGDMGDVTAAGRTKKDSGRGRKAEERAFKELVRKARGDADRAERLVRYEMGRDPGMERIDYIRRAIDRLEYDRRN